MEEVNIENVQKSINKIIIMIFCGLNLLVQPISGVLLISNHVKWETILSFGIGIFIYFLGLSLFICTCFIEIVFAEGLKAIWSKNKVYRIFRLIIVIIFIPLILILAVADVLGLPNTLNLLIYMNLMVSYLPITVGSSNAILYDDWIIYGTTITKITNISEYTNKTVCVFKKRQSLIIKLKNRKQILLTGKKHQFDQLIDYIELHKYIEKNYAKEKAECVSNKH